MGIEEKKEVGSTCDMPPRGGIEEVILQLAQ